MDGETGQLVWSESYSTLNNERPAAAAADAEGHLYTVGRAFSDDELYDIVVQKYHADYGTTQWTRFIASSGHLDDVGWDIAIDSQGRVVVAGMTGTSASEADAVVAVLDPDFGETVWQENSAVFEAAKQSIHLP